MKTLKKKFSIYQSSQKVRKLWVEYSEAGGGESRDPGTVAGTDGTGSNSLISLDLLAAGQGPGRALRAFVDAVDLGDARQASVLQSLDDGGQGELVATLLELAEALVGAVPRKGVLKPDPADTALAEKALKLVEACLTGNSNPKRPRDWKEIIRKLVIILAGEPGGTEGRGLLDFNKTRPGKGVEDVKTVTLRILRLVTTGHERVVEVGRCVGFQMIARLALPQDSTLSSQATVTIAYLISESDRTRSPTGHEALHRETTGRWGRVGRFGNNIRTGSSSDGRVSSECPGRGPSGEEGLEGGVASSSSSPLADAASFVLSSFQALVGRETSGLSSPENLATPLGGAASIGHLPMPILRDSLAAESDRVAALEYSFRGGKNIQETEIDRSKCSPTDEALPEDFVAGDAGVDVAEMMLTQGVIVVLISVIAPPVSGHGAKPPGGIAIPDTDGNLEVGNHQLDAFEAAVSIMEGRPRAQAEFTELGGFARVSRLIHLVANGEASELTQPCKARHSIHCDQSRSMPRAGSVASGEDRSRSGSLRALDATFDALFRLAINGRSIRCAASADGIQAVKFLLFLAARSPSTVVALRAAHSLQALLRVRPLNAVVLERYDALGVLSDAAADLLLPRSRKYWADVCNSTEFECGMGDAENVAAGRVGWCAHGKGEVLSSLNEVIRMLAAAYSWQDAQALNRYARILLRASTARLGEVSQKKIGVLCSSCGAAPGRSIGMKIRRCLVAGCSGGDGLCSVCDAKSHQGGTEVNHVRVPVSPRGCVEVDSWADSSHSNVDPIWAVQAGKAMLNAMMTMLDDRESFGLPPTPKPSGSTADPEDGGVGGVTEDSHVGVLTAILYVAQDELLAPLWPHLHLGMDESQSKRVQSASAQPPAAEDAVAGESAYIPTNPAVLSKHCVRDWTEGWLLGALEIVARLVVRGDDATVRELSTAGGWGLLAHVTRQSEPSVLNVEKSPDSGEGGDGDASAVVSDLDHNELLSADVWMGWLGARRLSLWILREALLTLAGTGQQHSCETGAAALAQSARWLVWLVRTLMKTDTAVAGVGVAAKASASQARDGTVMRLAILNELRLAVGSFSPCEVVMPDCTRVLPLVALRARSPTSIAADPTVDCSRRTGVSPNRHPEAQTGAINVKVVGRLAGDQLGVVRDTLVSEGLMEALLAIVEGDGMVPQRSSGEAKAESGLALLCLADLAAGSEKGKARLGSTLGYDVLATAAFRAGVSMHGQHFSLWLEASLRRFDGANARLPPPFLSLITHPGYAMTLASIHSLKSGHGGDSSSAPAVDGADMQLNGHVPSRGRTETRGGRSRGRRKQSPRSRSNPGAKDGITWVPRTLPKLSLGLGRGASGPEDGETEAEATVIVGQGHMNIKPVATACLFDELWLPPGLVTLAQDVLLINRSRGAGATRGEARYFIAHARGTKSATISESEPSLWRPSRAKFRGLEAAVFPFLLLPLVPPRHQPQAAGQLSCLLDANPANAAALCVLRAPLALLKLACRLPDQSPVRDLYFRLAAQLMSHHMSPADATELFRLASLQPSAWGRLGRLRVASTTSLFSRDEFGRQRQAKGGTMATEGGAKLFYAGQGNTYNAVALPAQSGELQMQLLYVIGTVLETSCPAWFFHMDGGTASGLVAGPLLRFPPRRVGYSLSMWLRPALFSSSLGGETALFLLSGKTEDEMHKPFLRVSLRRCQRPGKNSAPPAAAGIGASEDDDQGTAADDASAVLQVSTIIDHSPDQQHEPAFGGWGNSVAPCVVREPEIRCGRWQYLVVTHANASDTSSAGTDGPWPDGSITVYVDGERRSLSPDAGTGGPAGQNPRVPIAYPKVNRVAGAALSASVGCEESGFPTTMGIGGPVISQLGTRFTGQIATVAVMEGAWNTEMAKAAFLRGPGAPPPGKRILLTAGPGDLPPTPFLDPVGSDEKTPDSIGSRHQDAHSVSAESVMRGDSSKGDVRLTVLGDRGSGAPQAEEGLGSVRNVPVSSAAMRSRLPILGPSDDSVGPVVLATAPLNANSCASDEPLSLSANFGDPPTASIEKRAMKTIAAQSRLSAIFAPLRRAIDIKYGVISDNTASREGPSLGNASPEHPGIDGTAAGGSVPGIAEAGGSGSQDSSMSMTVVSLAVAAGCGGSKDSAADGRLSFRLAGRGTSVYATTPLHVAVQAAGGFRLCLPFLRMDHARQVAALRVLAGLLEASAEGMDAFRVRDGFNVLYHALAQSDEALQQLSMDSFDTLFDLMTSEALQGAVEVPAGSLSSVSFLDAAGGNSGRDEGYGVAGLAGVKPVRSPEALRLVVDLLCHCERAPELQARVMEALVDALDGSSAGLQVWRRAFNDTAALAPLLYLLSPPTYACFDGDDDPGIDSLASVSTRSNGARRTPSLLPSSASGAAGVRDESSVFTRICTGERPVKTAGPAARAQVIRMLQVLITGSATAAPAVRPQDPTAVVASSTSAGCTSEHLAVLVGFVLRCHLEAEALEGTVRREMLNTGQEDSWGRPPARGSQSAPESTLSLLVLTRRVGGAVLDLLVQLCGGDGGAVVVGMLSGAFPGGGQFFVPLELMSSSHVETRISAIKLLSLMLVRKGDDGRRSTTSAFFSSDESNAGGRPGPDHQALRSFEKLGGFAAMCRQLELHTACQSVCDALVGMIFGAWGSKHEPRPISEKDVLAIKGNKESWLRAWWRDYSTSPDDDSANPPAAVTAAPVSVGPPANEGSSLVDRIMGAAAATVSTAATTPSLLPTPAGVGEGAALTRVVLGSHDVEDDTQDISKNNHAPDITTVPVANAHMLEPGISDVAADCAPSVGDNPNPNSDVQPTSGGMVKPGRFAALLKAVESQNSVAPLKSEVAVHAAMLAQASGSVDKIGDKEETGFLSGFFRRLSLDHAGGDTPGPRGVATEIAVKTVPPPVPSATDGASVSGAEQFPSTDELREDTSLDPPPIESSSTGDKPGAGGSGESTAGCEQKVFNSSVDAGGSGGDETLNVVLPEAMEVLLRVLHRAPNPAVLARPLLQLESAVAWLPTSSGAHEGQGAARSLNNGREDSEGGSRLVGGRGISGGLSASRSGVGTGGTGRSTTKDGSDRERNAESIMSRQGWLAWCSRLVDALGARSDSGELVSGRSTTGYVGGGSDLGGLDRWGTGGSEASEAGGYLDDSHSETTDTGSAFSYYESSSVGRSLAQDGGAGALAAFTGPVYGLVAALLEQDMARAPRDRRGHRFLELFSLSSASSSSSSVNSFQAAVLEDALDGIQDSPMLSTDMNNAQHLSPTKSGAAGGGGHSAHGSSDGNVRRLESLRELLSVALNRRPDLPLGLCVKSVHTINLLGYHNSHEARSRMKTVGLLGVRDDLVKRCLFHPTASASEKITALSQIEDALETLVSQTGKAGGEAEASVAGEVAVQLMHLFTEVAAYASTLPSIAVAHPAGLLSPMVRSISALTSARATQVAAARALSRVAAANATCRTTIIRLARNPQLLARLVSPTAEEMEAIELGNIPDASPALPTGSRWSLGSLNLLPTSTGPTSCMSDDAEDDPETIIQQTSQQQLLSPPHPPSKETIIAATTITTTTAAKAVFPLCPSPSSSIVVGSWPPFQPTGVESGSSMLVSRGGSGSGSSSNGGGGGGSGGAGPSEGVGTSSGSAATVGGGAAGSSYQFRLDDVLEEEEEEVIEEERQGHEEPDNVEIEEDLGLGLSSGADGNSGTAGSKSPFARRARKRSSSDLSVGSLESFTAAFGGTGGAGTMGGELRERQEQSLGGNSWHGLNNAGQSAGMPLSGTGGWGVPDQDLHAFVRWYNVEDRREMRERVRRRVSKALAPFAKARRKTAAKHALKRDKSLRQAQKREGEATAAKEKAATDALERCRAHAERSAERASTLIDTWLGERRKRWEAGRTRCEELAPPAGTGTARGDTGAVSAADTVMDGAAVMGERSRSDGHDALWEENDGIAATWQGPGASVGWDWGRAGEDGLRFEEFFETFAGWDPQQEDFH